MHGRLSIGALTLGALAIAAAYALAFAGGQALAPWLLAAGASLVLTGLGLLGAGAGRPRLAAAVLVCCACTFVGFAVGLLMTPPSVESPLLFGLPRATTLLLVISGFVPLVLLPVAYAWAFSREVMGDE